VQVFRPFFVVICFNELDFTNITRHDYYYH
jgi:hypothetical protein